MKAVSCLCAIACFSTGMLCHAAEIKPNFEVSDVHRTNHPVNPNIGVRGPFIRNGQFEIFGATMLDLITFAYGLAPEKVLGGPKWLEMTRFDIIAKMPGKATPDDMKVMLQALLADRLQLTVHNDKVPSTVFVLSLGKGKPKLKEAEGAKAPGCNGVPQNPAPGTVAYNVVACNNMTMADFADNIHNMAGAYLNNPVVDTTGLKGEYDLELKWTSRGLLTQAGADGITVFDAVDKQLGLKLELGKMAMPAMVVDSALETPTPNAPDIASKLKETEMATEFEVATIQPTPADFQGARFQVQPGGRINLQGVTLRLLFQQAWNLSDEMIIGAPKWVDSDRFDIVAKAPASIMTSGAGNNGPPVDFDAVLAMVRNLVVQRFKMVSHTEERAVPAFTLTAVKPKMTQADPNSRTRFSEGPAKPDAKDPRNTTPILARLVTVQNMTMAQFADQLQAIAPGYIHSPVLDATGLEGSWDFTVSFTPINLLQQQAAKREGEVASDPIGSLSLPEAIEKQLGLKLEMKKRPVSVLVIDKIEQKPVDNLM